MKGITVLLYEKKIVGYDDMHAPIYEEEPVSVENVLVAPVSGQEVVDTLELTGRRAIYQLGIPKGDEHAWEDSRVSFFGKDWRTIGPPLEGIEDLIPLKWNKKIQVERYG